MLAGSSVTEFGWRGIGRSCVPNARVASRPTIDPTAMPSIAGAIIFDSPAIIAIIGSPRPSGSSMRRSRAEGRGHLGEQVAVGVERPAGPLAAGHDLRLGRCRRSCPTTSATWNQAMRRARRRTVGRPGRRWPRVSHRWPRAGRTGGRHPSSAGPGPAAPWPGRRTSAAGEKKSCRPLRSWIVGHGVMPRSAQAHASTLSERRHREIRSSDDRRPPSTTPRSWVHITGAEGAWPGGCCGCSAPTAASSPARRPRPTSSSTSARRTTTAAPGAGRTSPTAPRRCSTTPSTGDAGHLVLVSSAMVYGAYANNPVPLTEDAILRPDVEFVYARQLAAVEAMADRWRRARPAAPSPCCARWWRWPPTALVARRRARRRLGQRFGRGRSAGAVPAPRRPRRRRSCSPSTGASTACSTWPPTGGSPASGCGRCRGRRHGSSCPSATPRSSAALRWRFQRGPIPPGLRSYTRAPWLVANDRLKAAGWRPDGHQRAGVRRGHRGEVVDDDHARSAARSCRSERWAC